MASAKADQSPHSLVSGTVSQNCDTRNPDTGATSVRAEAQLTMRLLTLRHAAWLVSKMDPQPLVKRAKARSAKPDTATGVLRFRVIFFSCLVQPQKATLIDKNRDVVDVPTCRDTGSVV